MPVVLGDEHGALAASAALLERGLLVPAIRPPTVAPGTSRLRVALSAAHTDAQVDPPGRRDWRRSIRLMPRPDRLVVVAGTATEVGKTFVGAAAPRPACDRERDAVAARKPAQSFAPDDARTDADVLAGATGEDPDSRVPASPLVRDCRWRPRWPPRRSGRPAFTVDDLVNELGLAGCRRRRAGRDGRWGAFADRR